MFKHRPRIDFGAARALLFRPVPCREAGPASRDRRVACRHETRTRAPLTVPGLRLHSTAASGMSDYPEPRRNVLVVDDEPYIGRIIQLKLETGPYHVELCHDGRSALELLRGDGSVDLILLDIMMPHVDGLDVLTELRTLPHRSGTPVIMLTAKGHERDRERAAALGASDFLTKPFSPKKLHARIDELFAN
jgi:two-component system, OmpR family, alkaline phosphatase synthesis response regulator PhoP